MIRNRLAFDALLCVAVLGALAFGGGCSTPRAGDGSSSLFRNAKAFLGDVFQLDGTLAGLVEINDLRTPLNLLGARYGIPDAGDKIVAGDQRVLEVLEARHEAAAAQARAWGPVAVVTNEQFVFDDGYPPAPVSSFRGIEAVEAPVWPGPRTNWVSREDVLTQYRAGDKAKIDADRARQAAKSAAIQQVVQLAAAGLISKDAQREMVEQILASPSAGAAVTNLPTVVAPPSPPPAGTNAPSGGLGNTVFGPFIPAHKS